MGGGFPEVLSGMAASRVVSMRTRLTALSVLATLAPVGTALAFVAQRDLRDIRNEMVTSSALIGYVIAEYSASAMAFDDRGDAERTLNGLSRDENVIAAGLYDHTGRLFAAYERRLPSPQSALPPHIVVARAPATTVGVEHVTVVQPVVSQGTRYGTLLALVSTAHLRSRIRGYLLSMGLLGLGALAAAGALALMLERMVSRPLLALADVARRIAATEDYSVRANSAGHDEIGLLAGAFNRMLTEIDGRQKQAQQAIRVRDDFLSIASHELKTPLTSLKLQVQGLSMMPPASLSPEDGARVKQTLDVIDRQVVRLDKLIANLLDVSRIAAGRLLIDPAEADLSTLVREVVRQFEPQLARCHCKLESRIEESVVGWWDAPRIDQVVTNLISNAIKYGDGKPIELSVESTPESARVTVRDHGIGISPEDQRRIFGRFERAASLSYGGLGLGLFISAQIVRAHGGTIRVESTPELGSLFTVELPRRPSNRGATT
ncbi:MAG: Sensory box histidine kinase [bacterium]|nr:Sensory box histidine kinase [bacterium]